VKQSSSCNVLALFDGLPVCVKAILISIYILLNVVGAT